MYKVLLGLALLFSLGIFSLTVVPYFVERKVQLQIRPLDDEELKGLDTVLVLREKVYLGETLSPELKARVDLATQLYHDGTVDTLVLSGEKVGKIYNEATAMKKYVLISGVPEEAILVDEKGTSILASLEHAKNLGETSLIIPAPAEELPRILYIANSLGLESLGVIVESPEVPISFSGSKENLLTLLTVFQLLFRR